VVILLVATITFEAWALTGFIDWSALAIGLCLGLLILILSSRRVRARLWLRIARRSPLHAPHVFAVTSHGLRVSSPKANAEIPWTTFRDVKCTDGRVFFFMSKRLAYIVPSRAFDSGADFNAFTAAALEYWQTRHRL